MKIRLPLNHEAIEEVENESDVNSGDLKAL